ncbi:MAG TPA: tetratricopeptide repeat protein [Phycisphaerales bacterium]|nr:tetratricopeptide repeat protein [Phycisphaerales bacterium]HIB49672.1 tetratricopeptide repeat protein [Phycisphaerales bacterium]HIN83837.1 tetratricopeptide repeat protein [Phycisphaerales bacterium]
MRKIAILVLLAALLSSCGGSEPKSGAVTIPIPAGKNAVEPSVAKLLNKTGNNLSQAMDDPQKWLIHGSALFANAYYNEAVLTLTQAININPEMPQATYLLATALWKVNKQAEAIQALQTSLGLIPEYDIGWRLLAEWQMERGEIERAETSARKAFELNPGRIGTRYVLAQSLMDGENYEEALPILEEVISVNKAPRWIYTLASQCYRQLGKTQQSEQALAKSGPPFVDWPDPMYKHIPNLIAGKAEIALYALHLNRVNGSENALPFLVKANKINPEHVDVRVALSMALQKKDQLNHAQKVLEELQGEANINYWKQYAALSIAQNDLDNAKEYVEKAIELDSEDANAQDIAAFIAKNQGETAEAISRWQEAARLYVEIELWEKAELSLAYASEIGELSQDGLCALALAQIELEHIVQARTTIQKILSIEPSNSKAVALQNRLLQE